MFEGSLVVICGLPLVWLARWHLRFPIPDVLMPKSELACIIWILAAIPAIGRLVGLTGTELFECDVGFKSGWGCTYGWAEVFPVVWLLGASLFTYVSLPAFFISVLSRFSSA